MATTKATTAAKAEVKKEEVKAVVETKKTEAPKAVVKKTVAKKAEAPKAEAKKVEAPKAETKKVEAPKAAAKAPAKKAEAKKAEAPKAETKKVAAPKAAAKAPAKKATTKATAKKAVAEVKIQVADREYTQEDLVKIANDVWVYDFDKKASELKKVQLFVKAEEFKVYYVFNDEITGDFNI